MPPGLHEVVGQIRRHSSGTENETALSPTPSQLENGLSPRRSQYEGVLSPRRSHIPMTPKDTAAAMLHPVLSRAREQRDEMVMSAASETTETSSPIGAKRSEGTGSHLPTLKTTAQVLQALKHPVRMPSFKGGEGVRVLVETREKNKRFLGMSVEYWDISLFSVKGRAWPMLPQVLYLIYCAAMITIIILCVPNYNATDNNKLNGLLSPIQTMGLALFLLLSFRTNSAYDRWWEGRKLWDTISVKIQDTARIALGWVAPLDREIASGLVRWSLTFAFVAKKHLRIENDYPELAGILSQADIDQMQEDIDPVGLVTLRMTELIEQAMHKGLSPPIFSTLDNNVHALMSSLTSAARIMATPMPFAYVIHLRSFMALWLLGLPFAFVSTLGWWSIIVCGVVGYQLLGFETIGVEIENPFGRDYNDIPLDMITAELFVKLADVLGKLGHMVDVEPMISADPMGRDEHVPHLHSRRRRSGTRDYSPPKGRAHVTHDGAADAV